MDATTPTPSPIPTVAEVVAATRGDDAAELRELVAAGLSRRAHRARLVRRPGSGRCFPPPGPPATFGRPLHPRAA